jgi:hypothetical protein
MMPFKRAIRKIVATFVALLVLASLAIAAAPLVVDGQLLRKQLVSRLEQFTGVSIEIRGRVQMTSFLSFAIEAEDIKANGLDAFGLGQGFTASRIKASIDWLDLIRGNHRFDKVILEGMNHSLGAAYEIMPIEDTLGRIIKTLDTTPFNEVVLRDARFYRVQADGGQTAFPLRLINMRLKRRDHSDFTVRGKAVWKNETLTIQGRKKAPVQVAGGVAHPLRLSIGGKPMTMALEGDLTLAPRLSLAGDVEFSSANFGMMPEWFGLDWTAEGMIRKLALEGRLRWTPEALTFEQGDLIVNGARGEGMLSVRSMASCPAIEGTIAFRFVNLDAFRPSQTPGAGGPAGLLSCLAADLRVSAEEMAVANVLAGPAAAAISVRNGKVNANIAELQIFDGVVRGAVEVDMAANPPAFSVRTTARDISLSRFAALTGTGALIEGRGVVNVDMQGRGLTQDAVLASLKGHSKIYVSEGGSLGPELLGMMAMLKPIANKEPNLSAFLKPDFKTFRAEIFADNGVIAARSLEINRAGWLISGNAKLVPSREHIEGQLKIRRAVDSAALVRTPLSASERQTLTFEGYWHHPTVTLNGKVLMQGEESGAGSYPN